MAKEVQVRCRCGEVVGVVTNASPQKVNRVICYCDDCQAFAHQLGRADLLNAQGGSDIVQVAPASLTFIKGQNRIAGVRLTPKGLFRWHTTCCNTPVGNTLGPRSPSSASSRRPSMAARRPSMPCSARRSARSSANTRSGRRRRLDRHQPDAAAARDHQGAGLAAARTGLAAPVLPSEDARADLSAARCCRRKSARNCARYADRNRRRGCRPSAAP